MMLRHLVLAGLLLGLSRSQTENCQPTNTDWGCCTASNPCKAGQGDCDNDSECAGSLMCGHDTGASYHAQRGAVGDPAMDVCEDVGNTMTIWVGDLADTSYSGWESKGCITISQPIIGGHCETSKFHDQAWGNQKGRLRLALYDASGSVIATWDPFGLAPQDKNAAGVFDQLYGYEDIVQMSGPSPCSPANEDWSCCTSSSPCANGKGDCDNDSDCQSGHCAMDVGTAYGVSSSFDVCEATSNPACSPAMQDWSCCSSSSPCTNGEGDCDYDADCLSGYCEMDVGTRYGLSSSWDVCSYPSGSTAVGTQDICLEAYVGAGGGHELYAEDLFFQADFAGAPGVLDVGHVHDNSHAFWEAKGTLELRGTVTSIDCEASAFYDQGWGNQKSQVRVALYDKYMTYKSSSNCFGIAPHVDAGAQSATFSNEIMTWRAEKGDFLTVETYVGGGGGHEIFVNDLKVTAHYGVLQVGRETFGPTNVADTSHASWETIGSMTLQTTLRTITCSSSSFRDQGWGNQKSRVRLQLVDSTGMEVHSEDCFGVAPHAPVAGGVSTTWTNNDLVWHATAGDTINIQTYVGGGGGHEIYADDLLVEATYGNPSDICNTSSDDPNMGGLCSVYTSAGLCSPVPVECALTCCLDNFILARLG